MSLFTLGSARAVLVVALVYSFPDVFNVIIHGIDLPLHKPVYTLYTEEEEEPAFYCPHSMD